VWVGVCRPLLSVNRSLVYVGAGPHLLAVETDTGKKVGHTCMHIGDVDRIEKALDGSVCMPRLRSCVRKPWAADSHDSTTCRPSCISPTDPLVCTPLCMCISALAGGDRGCRCSAAPHQQVGPTTHTYTTQAYYSLHSG
jgi:hypothetical protein